MRFWLRLGLVFAASQLDGCATLAPLAEDTCGNGVVDAHEDCDTFAPVGARCGAPGQPNACRFDCSAGAKCPAGFGCGGDSTCRAPSGAFDLSAQPIPSTAWKLEAGDFNGDHRSDLLEMDLFTIQAAQVEGRILFLDPLLDQLTTVSLPRMGSTPYVIDLNRDGLDDVLLTTSDGGIVRLFGRRDRSLGSVAELSMSFPGTTILPFFSPLMGALFYIKTEGNETAIFGTNAQAQPTRIATLPGAPTSVAYMRSTRRDAIAFSYRGNPYVSVVGISATDAQTLDHSWIVNSLSQSIPLRGDPPIGIGIVVARLDDEPYPSILVNVDDHTYVAHADDSGTYTAAVPMNIRDTDGTSERLPFPLAIGDINRDGISDYVVSDSFYTSRFELAGDDAGTKNLIFASSASTLPWAAARLADMDSDGWLDLVAARVSGGIDYMTGNDGLLLSRGFIPTAAPQKLLEVADFDGDLFDDVALAAGGSSIDEVRILYGRIGLPELSPGVTVPDVSSLISSEPDIATGTLPQIIAAYAPPLAGGQPNGLAWFTAVERREVSPYLPGVPATAVVAGDFVADGSRYVAFIGERGGRWNPQLNVLQPPALDFAWHSWSTPFGREVLTTFNYAPLAAGVTDATATASIVGLVPQANAMAIFTAKADSSTGALAAMAPSAPVVTDDGALQPDAAIQLALEDIDGDGARDAIVCGPVGQAPATPKREVIVLWNDGHGNFDPASATNISRSGAVDPQAFAIVRVSKDGPPAVAWVTPTSTQYVRVDARRKPMQIITVAGPNPGQAVGGTGIASGDFDGDGVDDLAIADGQVVTIARGQAVRP